MSRSSTLTATDLFCGAGGSSAGASLVDGIEISMAMNHWALAVDTHNTNFPNARHHCGDIHTMNPRFYPSTEILIASPECVNHSLAKGVQRRKAIEGGMIFPEFGPEPEASMERSRATMWDVPRFAEAHDYRQVYVENVPDAKRWIMYDAWVIAMRSLGYVHHEVFLNSMFGGPVPQSRDRMYVVFSKKGDPIPDFDIRPAAWCWDCEGQVEGVQTWKNPAKPWGKYKQQYTYNCPKCKAVVSPFAEAAHTAIDWSIRGQRIGDRKDPLADKTMARIQAGIDKYWKAGLVDLSHGAEKSRPIDDPMFTQTSRNTQALFEAFIAEQRGTSSARSVNDPLMGITAGGNHHGLVEPLYVKNFEGGSEMSHPVSDPLGTITAIDHHALLMRYYSRDSAIHQVSDPIGTLTPEQIPALIQGLAVDLAMNYTGHKGDRTKPLTLPFHTLTTAYTLGLLTPAGGTWNDAAKSTSEPMSALTTREALGLVDHPAFRSFMASYYSGSQILRRTTEPMATLSTQDRHGLIEGAREVPDIEDCSFRMLEPEEIGRGMAFDPSYRVLGNKRERVRQYGNAVTPPVFTLLVNRGVNALRAEGKHANKEAA